MKPEIRQVTTTASGVTETSSGTRLARRLKFFDATMLVMGSILGASIFVVPHNVAGLVHSQKLLLLAWLCGGVTSIIGAFVYAELSARRPKVGGQYAYLREAYHPALAFVYGWNLLLIVQTGAMASVAVVFAKYFLELTHASVSGGVITTLAIGLLSIINCFGVRTGSTLQNIFMILKIAAIVLLVVCGLFAANHNPSSPPEPSAGAANFGEALILVFFAYGGFHMATFIAGEVQEPHKNMPRAMVMGVGGVTVLYLATTFACAHALGMQKLAETETPASEVMRLALGETGATIISLGIAVYTLGYLSQAALTSPRVYFAMAEDKLFFKSVAWLHPKSKSPIVAILLQGAIAIIIALSGKYEQILKYVMSTEMIFIGLTAMSLFIFRRRDARGDDHIPIIKMPLHPISTIYFAGVCWLLAVILFYSSPANSLTGISIALAGFPVYLFWRWYRRR